MGGDAAFTGEFRAEDNIVREIQSGGVKVLMHKNGIQISSSFFIPQLAIHNSQIINTQFADTAELAKQNKSVVGRAVVGGLIMGPLGAIIGGMSGIGTKRGKDNSYLVINYWDITLKQAQTILIRGENSEIRAFVGRLNTERSKMIAAKSGKSIPKSGCMVIFAIPIISGIIYYFLNLILK